MILDASAVLAFLFRETGADLVAPHLAGSQIASVNWSEILARFSREGVPIEPIDLQLRKAGCRVVDFTHQHAVLAADLVPLTSARGLGLGDRACLALGLQTGLPIYTADAAWADLALGLDIRLIR